VKYLVRFYGGVKKVYENGKEKTVWDGGEEIIAQAYDNPIPGYNTWNTINLRLWKSLPTQEFDFSLFNSGNYLQAVEARERAENITSVLYPNDNSMQGKELRLKQQYFFVAATIQDVLRRFKANNKDLSDLPSKIAIQLNDTHPALGIVELIRILVDKEDMEWEKAFEIAYKAFSYTNHTVLPEALEKWSVDFLARLLPGTWR
jgi:glycogen phosphorylase